MPSRKSAVAAQRIEADGSGVAAQAELVLQNDRYFVELTRTRIGEAFDPALGFVPRADQQRWGGQVSFRPRFEQSTWAQHARIEQVATEDLALVRPETTEIFVIERQ